MVGFSRQSSLRSQKGFSLVELLCVIAIMSLMASVTWPAIVGVMSGNRLTNNAYELSGLIQQARTAAVSQHTYVWLGFYSYTSPEGAQSLAVVSLSDNSGLSTDIQTDIQNDNYRLSAKPVILNSVALATAQNYAALPGLDTTDNTDAGSQSYSFQFSIPGHANATFSDVIVFGPDGQVWLPSSSGALPQYPVQCVGVGLNATPISSAKLHTIAVQAHGLSGQVGVFQQ